VRFMMLLKADKTTETGALPTHHDLEVMGKYNEELVEWAKRAPFDRLPSNGRTAEIELRQMFEITDFADVPPAVAELEESFKASRGKS
jgi:hypothetical protein